MMHWVYESFFIFIIKVEVISRSRIIYRLWEQILLIWKSIKISYGIYLSWKGYFVSRIQLEVFWYSYKCRYMSLHSILSNMSYLKQVLIIVVLSFIKRVNLSFLFNIESLIPVYNVYIRFKSMVVLTWVYESEKTEKQKNNIDINIGYKLKKWQSN